MNAGSSQSPSFWHVLRVLVMKSWSIVGVGVEIRPANTLRKLEIGNMEF